MKKNKSNLILNLRKKLKRKHSIGSWIQIPSPSLAEIFGSQGYDWTAVDMEHGPISLESLTDLFRAIENGGSLPFTRVFDLNLENCRRILDAGAAGLIFPQIKNANQLKNLILGCQYPPAGNRGVGFSRANRFGQNFKKQIKNFKPFMVAMIENKEAIQNLDKILQVEGLDAIFIGPYDLSASINVLAKFKSKKFQNILKQILIKSKKYKIPCGIHLVTPDKLDLKKKIKDGYKFIAYSMDTVILREGIKYPK